MEIVNQWSFIIIEKTNLTKKESRNPIFGVDVGQSQQIIDIILQSLKSHRSFVKLDPDAHRKKTPAASGPAKNGSVSTALPTSTIPHLAGLEMSSLQHDNQPLFGLLGCAGCLPLLGQLQLSVLRTLPLLAHHRHSEI